MPGCFTPTEILDAWEMGADIVKVFPATSVGPGYLKDIRGPLPQVKLMPTGGVSIDNAGDWLRAGAVAVGVGSALVDTKAIAGEAVQRHHRQRAPHRRERCSCAQRGMTQLMMPKVVTFGEIMLRLSPPGFERFLQSPVLGATFGGGEANVAVSLALFGLDSYYVTRLPKHDIGEAAVRALRAEGVKTDFIIRGGDRVGVYFVEAGASQRASNVIYDRARSAISELEPGTVDWAKVFQGADWFHVTGITPALGEKAAACTRESIEAAKKAGVKVSVDLNFRKKLWTEAQAQKVMRPLMTPCRCRHRERRGHAVGARARGAEHRCDVGSLESRRLQERRAAPVEGVRTADGRDYAARERVRQRQRVERRRSGTTRPAGSCRASATTCGSSIASAAATVSRRG